MDFALKPFFHRSAEAVLEVVKAFHDHPTDLKAGNLTGLLAHIEPAIARIHEDGRPRNSKNSGFVETVAEANFRLVMRQVRERSLILRNLLDRGQIALVGGMYDISSGKVTFYENN